MIEFTYEAILERLKKNLSKRLENSGTLFYSTNQRILEAIAEELSEQMRYNEYLTNEAKWSTAQNLSSVMAQVDFFGYSPHRKIGANGIVKVSTSKKFNGTWPFAITIPKFTQFSNGEYLFASSEEVVLYSSLQAVNIPIVQGIVRREEFPTVAYDDLHLSKFSISIENTSIENEILEVKVNGRVWRQVDFLEEATVFGEQIFIVRNNLDFSGITITFGDGVVSKKISSGDLIEVTYLETAGEDGEVLKANNITQVVSNLRDQNNTLVKLYCTNESYVSGGKNEETIDKIKKEAPQSFKTGNTLITSQDYKSAIKNTYIPDKVVVWGEAEHNIDKNLPLGTFVEAIENMIYVSALTISETTKEATPLTESQQDQIYSLIADRKGITDIVRFVKSQITFFDVYSIVYFDKTTYTADFVKATVLKELEEEYSISNLDRDFKEDLYFSQYYTFLNRIESVNHHETDIKLFQIYPSEDVSGSSYIFSVALNYRDVRKESVKIYIRTIDDLVDAEHPYSYKNINTGGWYLIGQDDGLGDFISAEVPTGAPSDIPNQGETFDISTIVPEDVFDYSNGSLNEIIVGKGIPSGWNDFLQFKVEFQTGDSQVNILPLYRNQIFGFSRAYIEAQGVAYS